MIVPLRWDDTTGVVHLLDQTRLPAEECWLRIETPDEMAEAIRRLRVRGAPAIGIAAAYGAVLSCASAASVLDVKAAIDLLAGTRPTAVNLFWALNRVRTRLAQVTDRPMPEVRAALLDEATAIEREDRESGLAIGRFGLELLHDGWTVLTHCHTGGVATSGYGTALAPLLLAAENGVRLSAYVDETRPLLQGSRITAWELMKAGVPATLITDSMAAWIMNLGRVQAVCVGADRIAANGDTANKIGTYGLSVLARAHNIPFYVFAPVSTIDLNTPSGAAITIEEREADEITRAFGRQTAPEGVPVFNPAFDVAPADNISAIVTERGIVRPPYTRNLASLLGD